ncbi:MAG: hypothetical protein WA958_00965 [Tunicatimonas sp.]
MKMLLLLIALGGLAACNLDKDTQVDDRKAKFTTSDPSELFFKNVRQIYYDQEEMAAAKLNIFRLGDRSEAEDYPVINLAIASNWRYDEAYLLVEPNAYFEELDSIRVTWKNAETQQEGRYRWARGSKEAQFKFASQLYRSIQQGHQLTVTNRQGQQEKLLDRYDDREVLRKTMFDYYRLVDLL